MVVLPSLLQSKVFLSSLNEQSELFSSVLLTSVILPLLLVDMFKSIFASETHQLLFPFVQLITGDKDGAHGSVIMMIESLLLHVSSFKTSVV